MGKRAPCKESATAPDCPNRSVGCQATCQKYLEFRAERDRITKARAKVMDSLEYVRISAWRKRYYITDGRYIISQR